MHVVQNTVAERFKLAVVEKLRPLGPSLVPVLRQLVQYEYPKEVVSIDFEVFMDGFTEGFPVRAFFMDSTNSEYFVSVDGRYEYPSPVDPDLLPIARVYGDDLEVPFLEKDENLDTFTLAGDALIPWFAKCWWQAGGGEFGRQATIRLHDSSRVFDLVRGVWREA